MRRFVQIQNHSLDLDLNDEVELLSKKAQDMNGLALSVTILLAAAVGFSAPAQAMSPSESYLAYRKALAGAETMNDLKSHLDSAKFNNMQTLSAKEQKENLELMKIFMIEFTTKLEVVSEKIDETRPL